MQHPAETRTMARLIGSKRLATAKNDPDPVRVGGAAHPAVLVDRVTKIYNEDTPQALVAIEDITMRVEQGEVIALLGPSGCGKSTLLKMIGGLYPPTEGNIFVDSVLVTEPSELTGMMFQKPVLFPWLKVVDWSSPRWPDTSTKSAFDVREWTQRVGKESCWEGNEQEESSRMSSNVTRWRLSAVLANRSARSPTSWVSMTRLWATGFVRMGSTEVSGKV